MGMDRAHFKETRKTWRMTIEEEMTETGKIWSEVKALANQSRLRSFTGPCVPLGTKGIEREMEIIMAKF
jgi:hypothetical protein